MVSVELSKRKITTYLAGLVAVAILGGVFLFKFNKLNEDLTFLTVFGNQVMEMNLIAEELNGNVILMEIEKVPEIRNSTALASMITARKIGEISLSINKLMNQMTPKLRSEILNSTAFGENFIWPYNRVYRLSLEMETVRKLDRRGAPIRYTNHEGLRVQITDPEPMILMANKIASPYLNYIKDARNEQRMFIYEKTMDYTYQLKMLALKFLATGAIALLIIAGLILWQRIRLDSHLLDASLVKSQTV